jgi:tetratricopeptide (TPR) repeat protein
MKAAQAPNPYNFLVVHIFLGLRRKAAHQLRIVLTIVAVMVFSSAVSGHAQAAASAAGHSAGDRGRILLILPLDNRSGQPNLEWIREAAADLFTSRFASAGFAPMTRADRMYALDHLGLPQAFQPSRASALKLAQTLDADAIIVGSYSTVGTDVLAEGQLIDVPHLRISEAVTSRGAMSDMITVFDSLAWKLTRQLDPTFNVAEATFVAAGKNVRLDAFEQYIRGITEPDQAERLRHLQQSVKLSPDFSNAWMALGRQFYQGQVYEQAAQAFSKVDRNSADGLEATFYRGLSLLFSGNYAEAEKSFANVAKTLPLAEVVNNQAVAVSRQGRDGTAQFIQAAADDPANSDYHFNLAVSLKRHGNSTAALNELGQCLKLKPADSEALSLQDAWKRPAIAQSVAAAGTDTGNDPLERIVRSFDASAFRQASQMLDEMDAATMADLSPRDRAVKLSSLGDGYLTRGLLLEAERLYQQATAADPQFPDAHIGLGRVRQRSGDLDGARKEAQTALAAAPSVGAWVLLAELDLASNRTDEAKTDAQNALRIEPANANAQAMLKQIVARTAQDK